MTRPVHVVLIALRPPASDPAWSVLPPRAAETLRGGFAVALLQAAGVPARQLAGTVATGVGPIAREVVRSGATHVAVDAGADPSDAVLLLTDLLLGGPDAPEVLWTGVPTGAREAVLGRAPDGVALLGPSFEQDLLAAVLGGAGGSTADAAPDALPSPWTSGALRPERASHLGVEHGRADEEGAIRRHRTARVRDELRVIDARVVGRPVVPLVGPPLVRADDEALDAVAAAGLRRVRPALPVAPTPAPELLRRAADLGVAELRVEVPAPLSDEHRAALARLARATDAAVRVELVASTDADPDRVESDVADLTGTVTAVALRWATPRGGDAAPPADLAPPELRADPAVAEALAAERAVSGRLLDALRRAGVPGRGPRTGSHDVVWLSGADPAEHASWLARVLDRDGLLVRRDGGTAPVGGIPTAVVRTDGDELRLPAGDRLVVRGWASAAADPADAHLLLTLRDAEDVERFAEDEAAAYADGRLPDRTAGSRWTLEGEAVALGLAVPAARLERLWVRDGRVLADPDGPPVGDVGDDPDLLRTTARAVEAASSPLDDPRRAWFVRALAAVRALRARNVEGPLRVAGLGGALSDRVEGEHRATTGVLVAAGELLHLVEPAGGRVSRVTPDTALVWELLAVVPDPAAAASALAAARGLPEDRAAAAVRQVLGGLGATLAPAPRTGART